MTLATVRSTELGAGQTPDQTGRYAEVDETAGCHITISEVTPMSLLSTRLREERRWANRPAAGDPRVTVTAEFGRFARALDRTRALIAGQLGPASQAAGITIAAGPAGGPYAATRVEYPAVMVNLRGRGA